MAVTTPSTKDELLEYLEQEWTDFHAYLQTLTETQLSVPTDAAGWTAKDHVIRQVVKAVRGDCERG